MPDESRPQPRVLGVGDLCAVGAVLLQGKIESAVHRLSLEAADAGEGALVRGGQPRDLGSDSGTVIDPRRAAGEDGILLARRIEARWPQARNLPGRDFPAERPALLHVQVGAVQDGLCSTDSARLGPVTERARGQRAAVRTPRRGLVQERRCVRPLVLREMLQNLVGRRCARLVNSVTHIPKIRHSR